MHSTDDEILEVVDSGNNVIGTATRAEIHRKGLFHRAVHIFVFNERGDLYVQRRSASKDRHPLKLDSSAAGHVDPGETYHETALRELEEELSIRAPVQEILKISACKETDNEHVVLFTAVTEKEPLPNAEEIVWGGFMSRKELKALIRKTRNDFVPAFILLWERFLGDET